MKLCIDPGHGFNNRGNGKYDPGACSAGVTEADIVLAWALTLKWVCAREGIEVFLTRDDDRDNTYVGTRDDKAEAAGCTHFLSLHCNAASPLARGTETFYRDHADRQFAKAVQASAMRTVKSKDRGLKSESQSQHKRLAVFGFDGPAALLEIGFITNSSDREKMLSREVRLAFAESFVLYLKGL